MRHPLKQLTLAVAMAAAFDCFTIQPAGASAADQVITRSTFREVAKKVSPAVVNIKIKSNIVFGQGGRGRVSIPQNFPLDDNMRDLLEQLLERESPHWSPSEREDYRYSRSASGVIVSAEGYIVTSHHVIDETRGEDIEVSLPDGRSFDKVTIVGQDDLTDLAVLKIEGKDLPHVEWGDSEAVEPGDHVVAIGNPLEFNNSVSEGIVSAKHRTINKAAIEDLIQTTAMINPGNSGGALVDLDGKLIGINMAIATSTGLWSGLGFAIPSKTVKEVTDQVVQHGKVARGYLGILMKPLTGALSQQLGYDQNFGVVVESVRPDSAAEQAGIQRYDVIAKVNGREIKEPSDMHRQIGARNAGETVDLEVYREAEKGGSADKKLVKVTLDERPSKQEIDQILERPVRPQAPGDTPKKVEGNTLGLKVAPNSNGQGVVVESVEPGSRAAVLGMKQGDIIFDVNKKPVKNQEDLMRAIAEHDSDTHMLYYESNGKTGMKTISPQ